MENTQLLNTFVENPQTLGVVVACLCAFLIAFSMLYNRLMDDLGDQKRGYTAILVAIGNLITLGAVAVISWKAAAIVLAALVVSGAFMIYGDIRRAKAPKKVSAHRRKALPYAAAGCISDALMALSDAQRNIRFVLSTNDASKVGLAGMDVDKAVLKLTEAAKVEGE